MLFKSFPVSYATNKQLRIPWLQAVNKIYSPFSFRATNLLQCDLVISFFERN